MAEISAWIIAGGAIVSAIATGFIAWYAVANYRLANAMKSLNRYLEQSLILQVVKAEGKLKKS